MNLDDLTIGDARKLAALFSTTTQTSDLAPSRISDLAPSRIDKMVLIRSRGAGVWMGRLHSRMTTAAGHSVALTEARRLWSWTGAAECSALALYGPTGGKIGAKCAPVIHEVLEEHLCAPAAVAALAAQPEWVK